MAAGAGDTAWAGVPVMFCTDWCGPVAVTTVSLLRVEGNVVHVRGLDALDGTPVLDLKPYIPMFDRVEHPVVPPWIDAIMDGYF